MNHPVIQLKVAGEVTRTFICDVMSSLNCCGRSLAEAIENDAADPMADYYVSRVVSQISEQVIMDTGNAIPQLQAAWQFLGNKFQGVYVKQRCFEGDHVLRNFSRSPYKQYKVYSNIRNLTFEETLQTGHLENQLTRTLDSVRHDVIDVCRRLIGDMGEDHPTCPRSNRNCPLNNHRPCTKVFYSPFNQQALRQWAPQISGPEVFSEEEKYPRVNGFVSHFARDPERRYPCVLIASYTYYWPWDVERKDGRRDFEPVSLLWRGETSEDMHLEYIATRSHWCPILFRPNGPITDPKSVLIHFSTRGHTPLPVPTKSYNLVRYDDLNKDLLDDLGKHLGPAWANLLTRLTRSSDIFRQFRGQPTTSPSSDYDVAWGWIPHNVELMCLTDETTIPFQAFVDMVAYYQMGRRGSKYLADSMGYLLNKFNITNLTTSLELGSLGSYSLYF